VHEFSLQLIDTLKTQYYSACDEYIKGIMRLASECSGIRERYVEDRGNNLTFFPVNLAEQIWIKMGLAGGVDEVSKGPWREDVLNARKVSTVSGTSYARTSPKCRLSVVSELNAPRRTETVATEDNFG
jgi:hypothetical protein